MSAVSQLRQLADELQREEERAAIVAMRTIPQWTTAPPTEPGWYWGVPQRADCKPEVVRVFRAYGGLEAEACGTYSQPLRDFVGWSWLRIEPPEAPT